LDNFDFIILGSGSAAFAAAIKASELGAKVVMIENDVVGRTCVNRGCIPTKNLIAAAELFYKARRPKFEGISFDGASLDFRELITQKNELVAKLRYEKYAKIAEEDPDIELVKGRARFISRNVVQVGDNRLKADKLLIATGSRPYIPPILGLKEVGYLTSRSILELEELPRSLLIIGGGFIAMEMGQMFERFGTEVIILERGSRVLKRFEPEISQAIRRFLEEEGVVIHTNALVRRIKRENGEIIADAVVEGGLRMFRTQHVLVATGRAPNTEDLGLQGVGVDMDDRGFVKVDSEMRTTAPNIWAAGDVTGLPMATPVAAREGVIAAQNAIGGKHIKMDYKTVPRAVFTDPEVASVGLTEAEAEKAGYRCMCRVLDLGLVPKALAIRESRGLVKIVADGITHQILGVHLVAPRGADIIHEAALAVKYRMTVEEIIGTVHVYPTISEAIRLAAQTFFKDVSRLSCCAE